MASLWKTGFSGALVKHGLAAMLAVGSLFAAAQASASVSITSTTITNYSYSLATDRFPTTGSSNSQSLLLDNTAPVTQLSLDTFTTADGGSFFFLDNNYCIGGCYISATTFTVLNITNTGTDSVSIQFGSQITAGYMAFQSTDGLTSSTMAGFNFSIAQQTKDANNNSVVPSHQLYNANGQATDSDIYINTSDGKAFNGLTSTDLGTSQSLEWDPTDISFDLGTLLPGYTTTIFYQSVTQVIADSSCADLASCDGAQIAFGDPRNNGGVTDFVARGVSALAVTDDDLPVIGRKFDPADLHVVITATSLAVPEPSSWALAIGGFAMVGAMMRRRQSPRLVTA